LDKAVVVVERLTVMAAVLAVAVLMEHLDNLTPEAMAALMVAAVVVVIP
jgi:hypothetical protein